MGEVAQNLQAVGDDPAKKNACRQNMLLPAGDRQREEDCYGEGTIFFLLLCWEKVAQRGSF